MHIEARMGRVEHWCQGGSAGLSVPAPFGWRCLTSPGMPRAPAPPHRTVRAVLPHTALRSPSATGMHGPPARSAQRPSRHRVAPGSGKEGSQPCGNPLVGTPVSGGVKVRPLPSAEVMLSSAYKRYYAPLRLPARPGSISAAPYTSLLSVPAHPAGSPVVPPGAILACHPCYPGGPPMPWQRWWASGRRSSSPDNGVDALTEVNEATPGFAARYGLRGCAHPFGRARQGTRCLGLPLTPPSSYPGALPAPGAGLPPASSRVSTAYCPVPFSYGRAGRRVHQGEERHSHCAQLPRAAAELHGPALLGARLLRIHRRTRRGRHSEVHPRARAGGPTPRPTDHV